MKRLAAVLMLMLSSTAAMAAPTCGPTQDILAGLLGKYGEAPAFVATISDTVAIVTVNPGTTTWTFLIQKSEGVLCMVASGENWGAVPPMKPGSDT